MPPLPSCIDANRSRRPALRGFTLVELLVVVAIIGVLVALLLPAVQAARESSRRTSCSNNLRQQGLALIGFESVRRTLPIGCIDCLEPPQRFHSWNSQILPWLEQGSLSKQLDFAVPSYQAPNIGAAAQTLDVFVCPSTLEQDVASKSGLWRRAAFTDYGGLYGVEGEGRDALEDDNSQHLELPSLGVMVYDEPVSFRDVLDGLSQPAAIAEMKLRRRGECEWISGHNIFAQDQETPINSTSGLGNDVGSPHPGGAQVAFCDGHVAFLSEQMEQAALNALLTRAGEEVRHE